MLHGEAKPSWGGGVGVREGGDCIVSLRHTATGEKEEGGGGDTVIPSFLQIKLISSRALLKEEVLQSGTSHPVGSPHKTLCYSRVPSCWAAAVKAEDLLPDLQPPHL